MKAQLLTALAPYRNTRHGSNRYNTPWRQNADGGTLAVNEGSDGRLVWFDHKEQIGGGEKDLAMRLGLNNYTPEPQHKATHSAPYSSLADYARAHGAPVEAFLAAGWHEVQRTVYPRKGGTARGPFLAFSIPTATGNRYRYANEKQAGRKYDHEVGWKACWYGLDRAVMLARETGQPLVIANGEASVVVAQYHRVAACCIPGGEKPTINARLLKALQDAWDGCIIVAFDCDDTGRRSAIGQAEQLQAIAGDVRAVNLGGNHGFDLADFCHLHNGTSVERLKDCDALAKPEPTLPACAPTIDVSHGSATIDITDENLGRVTDAIWAAMLASPYGASLYRYGTEIAYFDQTLTTMDDPRWRGMVNRAASFVTTKQGKRGPTTTEVIPPLAMIRDSLIFAPATLPAIERLSPLPVFDAGGRLLTNGYHADSRTLVVSDIEPKQLDRDAALSLIFDDLLVDFPFATRADWANALAYLLLPFIREMCGAVPVFLIDAAQRGTGKTLLNDLIHTIWTGAPAAVSDLPLNAEEQRKAITTHLMSAPVSVVFDDIPMLQGHALQRAVTGQVWTDRILGVNKEISVPIRTIWAATGNNVILAGDMVRRTVLIRLESSEESPSQRTGFKRGESELRAWVRECRAQLVSACTSLVAYGLAHGQPGDVVLGGFDQFARVVTRILNGIGVQGFCENLTAVLAREDGRQSGWKAIIRAWWSTYGDGAIKAGDIATLIEATPDSEISIDGDTARARAITVGKLVKAKIGAVFAFEGVRLRVATSKNTKGDTLYQLETVQAGEAYQVQHGEGTERFSAPGSHRGSSGSSGSSLSPYSSGVHARARAEEKPGVAISATSATSATASESQKTTQPLPGMADRLRAGQESERKALIDEYERLTGGIPRDPPTVEDLRRLVAAARAAAAAGDREP